MLKFADSIIVVVLGLLLFPLLILAVFMPFGAIGSLIRGDYKDAAYYLLTAAVALLSMRAITNYLKTREEL